MYAFCNVFSKLYQICSGNRTIYAPQQLGLQKLCVASYLAANTAVTLAQFDVYVSLAGWSSVEELMNDPAGLRALEATILATVPNVVGVDSSVVGGGLHQRKTEELSERKMVDNTISVKLTIQMIPPKTTTGDPPALAVAHTVQQLNDVISTPTFTETLSVMRSVSPEAFIVNLTESDVITPIPVATTAPPIANIPIQNIPLPINIILLSTIAPTARPTTAPIVLVDSIYGYLVQAIGFIPLVTVFVLTGCCILTCLMLLHRSYKVYSKHQEEIDMKVLDKLFPPAMDDGDDTVIKDE